MKKIPSLSPREKNIFYITVVVISAYVIYNFLISPFIIKWRKTNQDFRQKTVKLQKYLQILHRAKRLQQWHESVPFDLKASEIQENGVTKILSYVETISKKSSVQITNISPGNMEGHGNYKFMFVELELKGRMRNIVEFIYNIESSPMMFTVEKLEISSTPEKSKNVKVFLEIKKLIII